MLAVTQNPIHSQLAHQDGSTNDGRKPKRRRLNGEEGPPAPQPKRYNGTSISGGNVVQGDHIGDVHHHNHHDSVKENGESLLEESRLKILVDSLKFQRMDARLHNVRSAHAKTCKWLFRHKGFLTWNDDSKLQEHNGFLWIKGKPGCGKSTIMKAALEWANKNKQKRGWITVSYFFNARAPGMLEKSTLGLYRSLVHQILQAVPDLRTSFEDMFSWKTLSEEIEWTVIELQEFLRKVISDTKRPCLCVLIDALDEGNLDEIRDMIGFLEDLSAYTDIESSLRVCLSSRHYPHITIKRGVALTVEQELEHDHDIQTYVYDKLSHLQGAEAEDLKAQICEKSAGIFLWVVLVIPILSQIYDQGQGLAELKRYLEILPRDLEGLFAEILARDANESRPPVVQFIHETVREFLRGSSGLACVDKVLAEELEGWSHAKLAQACLNYFVRNRGRVNISSRHTERDWHHSHESWELWLESNTGVDHAKTEYETEFRLMRYSISYLLAHAELAQQHGRAQNSCLQLLSNGKGGIDDHWRYLRNIYETHRIRRYAATVTLLYMVAEMNLPYLTRLLVNDTKIVNTTCGRYGSTLKVACRGGNEHIVRCLLESGADVNARGGENGHAVVAAAFRKHFHLLPILLEYGAKPTQKDLLRSLITCVLNGHQATVKLLLDMCDDINAIVRHVRASTLMRAAVLSDNVQMVALLLDRGATVSHCCGLLATAACNVNLEIVDLLMDHGALVDEKSFQPEDIGKDPISTEFYTPLALAASRGHLEVVKRLVARGADVNAISDVMIKVTKAVYVKVSNFLLENGATSDAWTSTTHAP